MQVEESNEEVALQIEKGCVLITEAGNHFGCTDVTTAKAMLIYHHYQKATSHKKELGFEVGFQLYSTAAFSLSYQLCGEKLNMREVVEFFYNMGIPHKQPVNYESLMAAVQIVQFDIHHNVLDGPYTPGNAANKPANANEYNKLDVAHRFVLCYMDQFVRFPEVQGKIIGVKTTSLKLLNTFYHCQKSLSYKPLELAWAAMHISFRINHIRIEDIRIIKKELDAAVDGRHHRTAMDEMVTVSEVRTRDLEEAMARKGRPRVN